MLGMLIFSCVCVSVCEVVEGTFGLGLTLNVAAFSLWIRGVLAQWTTSHSVTIKCL